MNPGREPSDHVPLGRLLHDDPGMWGVPLSSESDGILDDAADVVAVVVAIVLMTVIALAC
jgi:hypothetical protein